MTLLYVTYMFRTFRLVIFIFMISYSISIFFCIVSELSHEIFDGESEDNFIGHYQLEEKTVYEASITVTYFAFTSLSTVGFGDYAPISNTERLVGAFMLLIGVAVFSYIMGNFIEILDKFKQLNESFEDGDNLSKFFGLLVRFNRGKDVNFELKQDIEAFFSYKWNNGKNLALECDEDISILQ